MEHAFDTCDTGAMRGDRIEVVIDTGDGVRSFDVVATRNGRRVEASTSRAVVEVAEVTRNGTPVRSARFMASRVVALVEHPAAEGNAARAAATYGDVAHAVTSDGDARRAEVSDS
jgi:hypothetical protein